MKKLINTLNTIINLIGDMNGATEAIDKAIIKLSNEYAKKELNLKYYYPVFTQKMKKEIWGEYDGHYGEIYINESYSHSCEMIKNKRYDLLAELIDTILHESRHAWQDEHNVDKSNYVSSEVDMNAYMNQSIEVDARSWAADNMGDAIDYIETNLVDELINN